MMAEPLDSIVQAMRDRAYLLSLHYWEKVVQERTRPLPSAIIASIGNNEPEIVESYANDPRGASCLLLGVNGQGRQIHSIIGYERHPMRIVTAYLPSDDRWINGRIRR